MNKFKARFKIGVMLALYSSVLIAREKADSSIYVKEIVIRGNETTKDFVIEREMTLKAGNRLTPEAIQYDQTRIYNLQLFTKVEISYTTEGDQATVFVDVTERWYLVPFPIIGFKYRDVEKLFYGAGFAHTNFRGRNEKIDFAFALGFDRWVKLIYQNPKLTDDDDIYLKYFITLSRVQNLNVSQGFYNQRVFSTGVTVGKRFGLYTTVLGSFSYDNWFVSDPREGRTVAKDGRDQFLTFGLRYSRDMRDLREYASNGYFISLSASKIGFGEGEVDLFRYEYDLRGYAPIVNDVTFGARTFGNFVSGGIAPSYLWVNFGYDERIRGYFHNVLEGEHILGISAEIRIPILKPRYVTVPIDFLPTEFRVWRFGLYAGIFADAGKTWYRRQSFSPVPWYVGYGAGLHFLLPYSVVVRTEYAFSDRGKGQFVLDFRASF